MEQQQEQQQQEQQQQEAQRAVAMADATAGSSSEPQTGLSWSDPLLPLGALNSDSVLEYFAHSPFYDRTCLNEQLKMQNMPPPEAARLLGRLPGVAYALESLGAGAAGAAAPKAGTAQLWVIRKLRRSLPEGKGEAQETTLRFYYVLDNVVYEAPSLAAVLRTRLLKIGWYLSEAFKASRKPPDEERSAEAAEEAGPEEPGSEQGSDAAPSRKRARLEEDGK